MTPKIVIYYLGEGNESYKILRSIDGISEKINDRSNWPIFIDLTFKPLLAEKVSHYLQSAPKLVYCSVAFANAGLQDNCSFFEEGFVKIQSLKAYPIISFFGKNISGKEELLKLRLPSNEVDEVSVPSNEALLLNFELTEFDFSVRTRNVLTNEKIRTLADLLKLSERELLALPNFGRKSLLELKNFIEERGFIFRTGDLGYSLNHEKQNEFLKKHGIPRKSLSAESHFQGMEPDFWDKKVFPKIEEPQNIFENLINSLEKFSSRNREIIYQRIGLCGDKKTLDQLGDLLGVTRERVRQIEQKVMGKLTYSSSGWNPNNIWGDLISDVMKTTDIPVDAGVLVARDKRLEFGVHGEQALLTLITSKLFDVKSLFQIKLNNKIYLARTHQDELVETQNGVNLLISKLEGKPLVEVESLAKGVIPLELEEFSKILISNALEHSILEEVDGEYFLQIYSDRRSAMTVARKIFKDMDKPATRDELLTIIENEFPDMEKRTVMNCFQELPEVFPFSHGSWGKIDFLNFSDLELLEIKGLLTKFVEEFDKEQFHSEEVVAYLKVIKSDYSSRLDHWKISGLIRNFKLASYLGRSMFSLSSSETDRLFVIDLIIELLNRKKMPMKETEVIKEIKKRRYFRGSNVNVRPPVMRVGGGYLCLEKWIVEVGQLGFYYKTQDQGKKNYLPFSLNKQVEFPFGDWTDQKLRRLRQLVNDGKDTESIAEQLELTRYEVNAGLDKLKSFSDEIGQSDSEISSKIQDNEHSPPSAWSAERVNNLKKMWSLGESASSIARKLGGVTRNAVLGKVHRLGLPKSTSEEGNLTKNINKNVPNAIDHLANITPMQEDWSDADLRRLRMFVDLGHDIKILARVLDREESDVQFMLNKLNI